jgi:hypothetical protein
MDTSTLSSMDTDKVRENRLRRMAERRGLRLEKSRRRDPMAADYGTYQIIDNDTNGIVSIGGGPLTLSQAEAQLCGWFTFHRAKSGEKVDAEAGSIITVSPGTVLDIAATGQHFIAQEDGSLRELSDEEMADELPELLRGIEVRGSLSPTLAALLQSEQPE